jgi:magnesium transporter
MLLQSIKMHASRGSDQKLLKLIDKVHAADLGLILGHLKHSEVQRIFALIQQDKERAAEVLIETDKELAVEILISLSPKNISEILQEMYSDDAAELIEQFPEELREQVLLEMQDDEQQEVEERLEFDEETAGRIMVPDYFSLRPETSVEEAIKAMHNTQDLEIVYYIYVTSDEGQLMGVVSLRQLLLVPPATRLKDIIETDLIVVNSHADQEDVARMVARYNLLAIPVVDDLGKMLGIVTVDDVIDIIKDEATEDMLKMAGAVGGEEKVVSGSILSNVRIRWPWLLASWIGGLFNFMITGHFDATIQQLAILVQFIPIVMGMGGNIGSQSSILVVRGLATRVIDSTRIWNIVFRELRIAFFLGLLYGTLLGIVVFTLLKLGIVNDPSIPELKFAVVIGLAVFCPMMAASIIGTLTPITLDRMHIDPAIATGPMVTSSIDVFGVLVYLTIATNLLL